MNRLCVTPALGFKIFAHSCRHAGWYWVGWRKWLPSETPVNTTTSTCPQTCNKLEAKPGSTAESSASAQQLGTPTTTLLVRLLEKRLSLPSKTSEWSIIKSSVTDLVSHLRIIECGLLMSHGDLYHDTHSLLILRVHKVKIKSYPGNTAHVLNFVARKENSIISTPGS